MANLREILYWFRYDFTRDEKPINYDDFDNICIVGKTGSGKSYYMTKLALDYANKGWLIVSNSRSLIEGITSIGFEGVYSPYHNDIQKLFELCDNDRQILLCFDEVQHLDSSALKFYRQVRKMGIKAIFVIQDLKLLNSDFRRLFKTIIDIRKRWRFARASYMRAESYEAMYQVGGVTNDKLKPYKVERYFIGDLSEYYSTIEIFD